MTDLVSQGEKLALFCVPAVQGNERLPLDVQHHSGNGVIEGVAIDGYLMPSPDVLEDSPWGEMWVLAVDSTRDPYALADLQSTSPSANICSGSVLPVYIIR